MANSVEYINDNLSVDVELLRVQRNTLIDLLDCLDNTKPTLFGLDKEQVHDALNGITNFLDAVLDDIELR